MSYFPSTHKTNITNITNITNKQTNTKPIKLIDSRILQTSPWMNSAAPAARATLGASPNDAGQGFIPQFFFLINKRSGGVQGEQVYRLIRTILAPRSSLFLQDLQPLLLGNVSTPDSSTNQETKHDSQKTVSAALAQLQPETRASLEALAHMSKSSPIAQREWPLWHLVLWQDHLRAWLDQSGWASQGVSYSLLDRLSLGEWLIRQAGCFPVCVVSAGGDGTVSWTVDVLRALGLLGSFQDPSLSSRDRAMSLNRPKSQSQSPQTPMQKFLPIAVFPLGTGNELARCSGWGARANISEAGLKKFMARLVYSPVVLLDQWELSLTPSNASDASDVGKVFSKTKMQMFCFFSIGFDAHIAHRFHVLRQKKPTMCNTVVGNKMIHTYYGAKQVFVPDKPLDGLVKLVVDGKEISLPQGIRTLQVLNIHSSADGTDFFGLSKQTPGRRDSLRTFRLPQPADGLIEVVATEGVPHFLKIRAGMGKSIRLAQGRKIQITYLSDDLPVCMQLDGDPWMQTSCTITIEWKDAVPLLIGPKKLSGGFENIPRLARLNRMHRETTQTEFLVDEGDDVDADNDDAADGDAHLDD